MAVDAGKIQKPIRKLHKLLKRNPKQPTPDQIHDLRTSVRRLEATFQALSLNCGGKGQRLLNDLTPIRKRAGKVRDLDVLTSFASSVRVDGEQDCKVQLLEHLGTERRKNARKFHAMVAEYGPSARNHVKRALRRIDLVISKNSKSTDAAEVSAQAAAAAFKLELQLAAPSRLRRANLHPYRLKVKQLQNVLKLASTADNQEFTDELGKVKDAIGEWHDWEELLAIARNVLGHGAECSLMRELKRIGDQRYRDALAATEDMRRKYLRVSSHKKGGHLAQPADAVWRATKAIAA